MASAIKQPHPEPSGDMTGKCSLCSTPIVFGDHGKALCATGWVWDTGPGHLLPICFGCRAALKHAHARNG